MNPPPRASVFIASYNHARFLPECLNSILAQTYQDFELIIVDDGSTDNSWEILKDYKERFPHKIEIYTHPGNENKGISATSNLAISKARGEYLAWTGSDDIWAPTKLEQQVAQLDSYPEYGMVYSCAQFIDETGNELGEIAGIDITTDPNPVGLMIRSCYPPAMTVVFRRKCLDEVGLFDESLIYSDWDLFIRIFSHWKVGFIEWPLAKYRIHASNTSKKINPKLDLQRITDFTLGIREKAESIQGSLAQPRNLALIDLQLCFLYFCSYDQIKAKCFIHSAFKIDPKLFKDMSFINNWLTNWKPDFYTDSHQNFNIWFISNLPPSFDPVSRASLLKSQLSHEEMISFYIHRGIQWGSGEGYIGAESGIFYDLPNNIELPDSWKEKVDREVCASLLFEYYKQRNKSKVKQYWWRLLQKDTSWLKNRGFISIGLRTFLGYKYNSVVEKK